ncbi:hypothetical protein PSYJA_10161, partial [Pseudomonas syringae pv. japonica str. M301072]
GECKVGLHDAERQQTQARVCLKADKASVLPVDVIG